MGILQMSTCGNYSYITFTVPATNASAAFVTDSCIRSNTPDNVILPPQNVLKFGHGENCPVHTHVLLPRCDSVYVPLRRSPTDDTPALVWNPSSRSSPCVPGPTNIAFELYPDIAILPAPSRSRTCVLSPMPTSASITVTRRADAGMLLNITLFPVSLTGVMAVIIGLQVPAPVNT